MSSNLITQPYKIILDPTGGGGRAKPVSNGLFYAGVRGLDPIANPRTDLAYQDESGTERELTSPLILNSSGAFVVSKTDGTLIQPYMKNGLGYSVLIQNKNGEDVYSNKNVGDPGNITEIVSSSNLIQNSDFSIAGSVKNPPDATPRTYNADDELFQGFKAVGQLSNVTYVNGMLNGTGQLYVDVYKTEKQKLSTVPHVASIASSDGIPVNHGVSFIDSGEYWRITFGMSNTFSVKFEQGSVSTRHEAQTDTQKKITTSKDIGVDLSSLSEDFTVYLDSEVNITSSQSISCRVVKVGGGVFNISSGETLSIYKLDCGPFQVFKGEGDVKLYNSINTETFPEWFGAVAYSNVNEALTGADSAPALNKIAKSLPTFGGEIKLSGLYGLDSSFEASRQGVHVKGIGAGLASGLIARTDVPTVNIPPSVYEVHLSDLLIQGFKDRSDPSSPVQGTQPCIKARDAYLLRFTNIYTEDGGEAANFFGCSDIHVQSWLGEDSTSGFTIVNSKQCTFNELNFFDLNSLGSKESPSGHFIKINSESNDNTFTNLNYRQSDKKLSDGILLEGFDNSLGIGSINDLAGNGILLQGSSCSGNTLSSINSRNSLRHVMINNAATNNQIRGGIGRNCSTALKITSSAGDKNDISISPVACTTDVSVEVGAPQQTIDNKMLRTIGSTEQRPGTTDGVMIGFVYTNTSTARKETWNGSMWLAY